MLTANLKITMFKSYVDDVRLASTLLRLGMRYCKIDKKFIHDDGAEMMDKMLEEAGETGDARMSRVCHPAMEDINPDLKFTTEVESDFPDGWMPTLDFKTEMQDDGTINHTYFQKAMKTPYVLMQRSAMASKQKFNILSNELIRRLSNINKEGTELEEKKRVIEEFTKEMKSSGWERYDAREMVVSGILGWERKHQRRIDRNCDFYRSAASTLPGRCRKKLTEKTSWYKEKEADEMQETATKTNSGEEMQGTPSAKENKTTPGTGGQKRKRDAEEEKSKKVKKNDIKAVINVPCTPGGELAKRVRAGEESL